MNLTKHNCGFSGYLFRETGYFQESGLKPKKINKNEGLQSKHMSLLRNSVAEGLQSKHMSLLRKICKTQVQIGFQVL